MRRVMAVLFSVALFSVSMALAVIGASAAFASEKQTIVLGTATPGGGFPVYGAAFAETINEFEPSLTIEPRNTKGSTENVPLLEAGKLDIALVQGEVANDVLFGLSRQAGNLRVIAAMYASPGLFVVRADSPDRTISDLAGKPIAFGAKGSGFVLLARHVLDALSLDQEKDFQAVYLERAGDGSAMVLDGRVAALWGGGIGWPGFAAVAKDPSGARFIAPDAEQRARILAKYPFIKPMSVPAGSYPGQAEDIQSVGSWSLVLARSSLDEDAAYKIAGALHRGAGAIAKRLPQARETTLANTIASVPSEMLHSGVARYAREAGASR